MLLLKRASVFNELLYNLPVHGRLAAEEIDLEISAGTRVRNQKIQCLLADFKTHQRSSAVVLALFRKTIATCEVAVVGNVKTERLDDSLSRLKVAHKALIAVRGEELLGINERLHGLNDFLNLLCRIIRLQFRADRLLGLLGERCRLLEFSDHRLGNLYRPVERRIRNMHGARVDVHHNGNAVVDKLVNQAFTCFLYTNFFIKHMRSPPEAGCKNTLQDKNPYNPLRL